ncbi:MAG: hypothetical protein AAGH78_12305 [Cyanobacteria bacterium P01_H01_bin.58]
MAIAQKCARFWNHPTDEQSTLLIALFQEVFHETLFVLGHVHCTRDRGFGTHCIGQTTHLNDLRADLNGDGEVTIDELRRYNRDARQS